MAYSSIEKILGKETQPVESGNGIPRCELYFSVEDLQLEFENAVKIGAKLLSPILDRNWGDKVCYFSDPDGHIIAFSKTLP